MQQWAKFILVLAWKMTMVGAQCPSGFTCSGRPPTSSCYLIYPSSNGWTYDDEDGNPHEGDNKEYASPNCYILLSLPMETPKSCNDAQRECEEVGGNITVINSNAENMRLKRMLRFLISDKNENKISLRQESSPSIKSIVHHHRCAKITTELPGNELEDLEQRKNNDCSTTHEVNTIVCESTDGSIPADRLSASSETDHNHGAHRERLNTQEYDGGKGTWKAHADNCDQWIQADLRVVTEVTGVITQGCNGRHGGWVKSYEVHHSVDGENFEIILGATGETEFSGNSDKDTAVTNMFNASVHARFIRIHPTAWQRHICLRFELLGCPSTDVNTEICPVPTADAMETTSPLTTTSSITAAPPPVHPTSLTWSSTANQSFTTDETTAEQTSIRTTDAMETTPPLTTTSSTTAVHQALTTDETTAEQTSSRPTRNHSEMEAERSEMEAGRNSWMVAVVVSIVVIAIVIILLSFLFIRRRRTKPGYSLGPNQHLPSIDQPIEDGNQDRATVSYSGAGDGVVINEYSTIEDHNQDLGAVVYHILEATDSPAPTSVTNDAYAVPYGDAAAKDGVQDQEYDTLNAADMHSRSPQQNELGGHGYAVPNKNSKGRKEQDVGEADDTLNAADMHSRSPQQNELGGDVYVVPNKNSKGRKEQDVEADDTLNAADMHSRSPQQNRLGGHGYAVPNKNSKGRKAKELDAGDAYDTLNATDMQPASKQRIGKPDDAFDDTYNMLNTAEVHSKSGKHNVGSGNEYGKLQNAADVPPKDGMYSYVTTEVGSGIVTMPHGGDQTYDKLQRNTELGGALTAAHHCGSLQ